MIAAAAPAYSGWSDTSVSAAADLAERLPPNTADSIGEAKLLRLHQPLVRALVEADAQGIQLRPEAIPHALRFIQVLPPELLDPEIVVEKTGSIAFDWEFGSRRNITVLIKPTGHAGYAALIDHEPIFGKVALAGRLPATIEHLFNRLMTRDADADR